MSAGAIEQGIPGGVDGTAAERLTGLAGEPLEYIPDHRNDPCPVYLGITDPAVLAEWEERYWRRMTGWRDAVRPAKPKQGVLGLAQEPLAGGAS